ncbi:MAG: HD domain-containing protein [Acidobacteria bacterium]|nr:HD domain-containing protein [Acidobacteriota bacterium]
MKSPTVADLAQHENQVVTAFFLVQSKQVRSTRDGKPYLALRLSDRTGVVEARLWDGVEDVAGSVEQDDVVKVEAVVEPYRGQLQLKLRRLRRAQENEVDLADFLPATREDVAALYEELLEVARGVGNAHLRELLLAVLTDAELAPRLKRAPGAKTLHHAYLGGLLEHVVSLCRLCRLAAQHYPDVDVDLLLTGAILHDLGKVYELSYERSFDYTTEGKLVGHIAIAVELVGRKMDAVAGFPRPLRTLVQHLLLSHHGRLEFGSPVTPRFREALLLHYLDDLDSKMEAIRGELASAEQSGRAGEWTDWNRALERPLLDREKFLQQALADAPPAETLFDSGPGKK